MNQSNRVKNCTLRSKKGLGTNPLPSRGLSPEDGAGGPPGFHRKMRRDISNITPDKWTPATDSEMAISFLNSRTELTSGEKRFTGEHSRAGEHAHSQGESTEARGSRMVVPEFVSHGLEPVQLGKSLAGCFLSVVSQTPEQVVQHDGNELRPQSQMVRLQFI